MTSARKLPRVGFVCLGNACRSQMAEGFARVYGDDVCEVHSAGLSPALAVPEQTVRIMAEKGIDLNDAFPKALSAYPKDYFDLLVNMSGYPVAGCARVREWPVPDPYGHKDKVYRAVRDQIEELVRGLIEDLRRD